MVVIIQLRNRNDQQTVVLAGVASCYRSARVRSAFIRAEILDVKRLLKVGKQSLVKLQIAHID